MWKLTIIFGIAMLTSLECFPSTIEYDSMSIENDSEEVISAVPSLETGEAGSNLPVDEAGKSGPLLYHLTHFPGKLHTMLPISWQEKKWARVAKWKPEDGINPEELGDTYFEGDIIVNHKTRNGLRAESARWKNGIVPYKISDQFNYKDYNTIMAAIEEYHKLTCVKWVRWSGEPDYVYFVPGKTGCWSSVGRVGGMQELNLQTPGCLTKKGTVIHEMLHALGFLHEQNRHERDDFVTINWQNIQKGRENNFEKATAETTDSYGVPYDYRSVMHYSANAFSSNGKPTIVPKTKVELGQREGLSKGDIKKIRGMYKC